MYWYLWPWTQLQDWEQYISIVHKLLSLGHFPSSGKKEDSKTRKIQDDKLVHVFPKFPLKWSEIKEEMQKTERPMMTSKLLRDKWKYMRSDWQKSTKEPWFSQASILPQPTSTSSHRSWQKDDTDPQRTRLTLPSFSCTPLTGSGQEERGAALQLTWVLCNELTRNESRLSSKSSEIPQWSPRLTDGHY